MNYIEDMILDVAMNYIEDMILDVAMNYIEDMILDVASRLYTDGNTKVTYKGMEFGFQEVEYANPMDMSCMTMINLNIPFYLRDTINDHLGVSYESQSNSWPRNGKREWYE